MENKKTSFQSWRGKHQRSSSSKKTEFQAPRIKVEQKVPISWTMF